MACSNRDDNLITPNYGLDTCLGTNKLRITIQIQGLKSSTILEFQKKIFPKLYKKASNGEIVFNLTGDGFLFEFHGKDSLKDQNYRLHVTKLPGVLDNKRSQLIVREDAVEIILLKTDDSSWSSVMHEGLNIIKNENK
ncbi:hypothetical protein EWB00_005811 [Schistosoma japonicum]|uniref:SJCHGC06502 protein n=1 Tax=Schistosoma japonicum TaxID=6182 RepID=Q5DFS7_SCHJA|nr:SJCHGC06502 protein [Schistosoma japonicum]TNN10004.1 hypothetical protein EWB00_005811 [Schistosoma japonicum]